MQFMKYSHFKCNQSSFSCFKDFKLDSGDLAYIVGIMDLLLERVGLGYRPEAGGLDLREQHIHDVSGYHFHVLKLFI